MYQLPSNFTGLKTEPLHFEEFKSFCYSLQGLGCIKVISVSGYDYPKNYYVASASDLEGAFNIYLNCFSGVLAFGDISDEKQLYLSKPRIESAAGAIQAQYSLIPVEVLGSEAGIENFKSLGKEVIKKVASWLPSNVGRLLFTWCFD